MSQKISKKILLEAYQKKKTARPPIWLMRQAGRYLPEYLKVREKYSINQVINTPELALEVTLQPLKRFALDGSIIFADLLTPLQGFGIEFAFEEKVGPVIYNPIKSVADVKSLTEFSAEESTAGTLAAIKLLRAELDQTYNQEKTLIGFAGAPFTVSSYLIEARSNPKLNLTKSFMFNEPLAWAELQNKLVKGLAEYLIAQVNAGAEALQIFDSWLGGLSREQFEIYVKPYLVELIKKVRQSTDVPLVFFATGINHLYPALADLDVEALGLDWRSSFQEVNTQLKGNFCLQGNLDPLLLFADWKLIEENLDRIFADSKNLPAYVFNLGHGILPKTPIANVEKLVNYVRNS